MAVCPPPSSKRKSGNTKSEISKNFQHLFSWEPGYVKFIGGGNRLFHTTLFMYFVIVILKTILWQKFSLNIFTKFYSIPESFQNPITFLWKLHWSMDLRVQGPNDEETELRTWLREFSKKRNEVRLTVRRRVCLITFRFSSHVLMSTPIISLKCMSHCHMANNNTFLIGDHAWDITGWWQVLATQTHRMTTWNIWLKENFFNFWILYCNRTQQIEGYGVEC